jgi:hypothetical protein
MSSISDLMQTVYADMDPVTGHFPETWCCLRCGKPLDGEHGRNPAETYAGTYNGLCYPCTGKEPYVEAIYTFDGAQRVSWPPHCPSWRRDRESFKGYPDCENCKGMGATRGYSGGMWSGPMWHYCHPCSERFHAARKLHDDLNTSLYYFGTWGLWQRVVEQAGGKLPKKLTLKILDKRSKEAAEVLGQDAVQKLIREAYEEFKAERDRLAVMFDYLYETRRPEQSSKGVSA